MVWLIIAIILTAVDQLIKYLIVSCANVSDTLLSLPNIIDITYVRNTGAAFSLMSGKLSLLSVISVAFCVGVIIYWARKKPSHPLLCASLTMMFSGALGNGIDRIFRGYVVDYIQTTFISFPVFNLADIGITVGAVLLVVYVMWFDKEDKHGKA